MPRPPPTLDYLPGRHDRIHGEYGSQKHVNDTNTEESDGKYENRGRCQ